MNTDLVEVYDDFLDKRGLKYIKKNIIDNIYFPWYYSSFKVVPGDNEGQFFQMFYNGHNQNSDHFKFLEPILNTNDNNDVCIMRTEAFGTDNGNKAGVRFEVIEEYDYRIRRKEKSAIQL